MSFMVPISVEEGSGGNSGRRAALRLPSDVRIVERRAGSTPIACSRSAARRRLPGPVAAEGSATITACRRNAVLLAVQTDRDVVVVLHDIHCPGWEAYVDGKPAHILRTNLLLRGVGVPPGGHCAEFVYRPVSARNLLAAAACLAGRTTDV